MKTKIALLFPSSRAAGMKELEPTARLGLRNARMAKAEDTEVVPCFLERGPAVPLLLLYRHLSFIHDMEMYRAAIQIERDGYEALMIGCCFEPAILQMRAALNIPVVAPLQTSMLLANTMGEKFGIVTVPSQYGVSLIDLEIVPRYGLKEKLASVRSVATAFEGHLKAMEDAHEVIKEFQRVGRECIADGAEVLVCGCMMMSIIIGAAPGCEKEFPNGLNEVDGVPIINNVTAMVKAAESMMALKKAGLPWISRKCTFAQASKEVEDDTEAAFPGYQGPMYFTL